MSAHWHYHDISILLQATLTHKGQRYIIPLHGGESLDHAMFKVSTAAHLLTWGYAWEQIHWEETVPYGPKGFRPDLYTEGNEHLPSFWFECVATNQEKLQAVIKALPNFRVVRIVDYQWFEYFWNGKDTYLIGDKLVEANRIEDWKERKRLITQQRESVIPPNAECWAIRGRENSPRIVYAVRRESDNRFIYLDSSEGWSLSSFRYVTKRSEGFQPLIPGVVGSEKWRGHSQEYYKK